ncbi:mitotic checkpoint serine/threonine-protein kinase BUB1 [Osmerus mordax]|uniref:mitotic checkpoint serine/threonine-protein kinase BUB1 n=1 Tax=Osmerus mordax TaxID=8014 RepID=UPI00350EDE3B
MDVSTYLQSFEESMTSYTGDDPLDSWARFYDFLEKRVPTEDAKGLSIVLDRLVQRFLEDGRYSNDIRFVNYCIKCASYYGEPIKLYSYVHSKGIGTTTAALYVAWAQQFEQLDQHQHADAVYQTAIENQAKPSDTVLQQYRMFQSRTSRRTAGGLDGPHPLQNSQLANQMSSHREPGLQCKEPEDLSQLPADRTVRIISRSENAVGKPSNQGSASGLQTVSMYCKDSLECQGSELCFEEVRAAKYYVRRKQEEECRELEARQRLAREKENELQRMKQLLDDLENNVEPTGSSPSYPPTQQVQCNTTATSLNPEFLHQSFRQPPSLHSLKNQPTVAQRLNWAPDVKPESERAPEALMQCNFLREPVADLSTQRCSPLFGKGLTDHWAAPTPSSHPQAPPLQAHVGEHNSQPSERSCPALQRPAWAHGAQNEAPHLENHPRMNHSMNHLASSFQQHNVRDQNMSACEAAESKLDVSQGATGNLSHVTPNTSLGIAHATPSRVLPSPTVNTREALDVIMDMFLAPTLLQDEPFSCLAQAEKSFDAGYHRMGDATPFNKPPTAALFAIFQDENDKENCSPAVTVDKPRPSRALVEIPVSKQEKPNETPTELIPEESTMWGARYNSLTSLAACPNSTGDFSLSAHMVSTPFQKKEPYSRDFEEDQENDDPRTFIGPEEKPYMRQPMKLSPIIEQSPSDENLLETAVGPTRLQGFAEQGTIVGEGLALGQGSLTACSMTEVHHAPALLSFRDHTLVPPQGPDVASSPPRASGSGWDVYTSPEQPPQAACPLSPVPPGALRRSQGFTLKSAVSPEKAPEPGFDVPMSPECVPRPEWLVIQSPEFVTERDLDALMSPQGPRKADVLPQESTDIPMSPEPKFSMDVPMSPAWIQKASMDAAMSPRQEMNVDVPMSPSAGAAAGTLVSDPWDEELISRLLETLSTPLTSHPDCITWQSKVPNISPKMTIKMGAGSLRVDCLLGEGAFATVYQATDLSTSKKMVLKVQKPANPWEFYINTQLNARLQPSARHLFSNILSAHLFQNGSVLLADLHNCGTLLNAVNLYKNQSDKVMPQPLVMYFTVCILYMVEQLHSIHIVHADIKPDNFLLGERFLDNTCFEPENLDHGLALIDLGQSIDMTLFPEGTEFTAKCLTSGFQCTEMLSGRPWNYQTDYFGIAGTVHCMIFGTYMQVKNEDGVWKTNAVFRRNPHSDLWNELFHTLLNVPDCRSLPSLRELRSRLCSVLQQNYRNKLASLKTRLVIQLLESRSARR